MSNEGIAQAKVKLPLPALWRLLNLPGEPTTSCKCPLHEDGRNSGSVFKRADGSWAFKCHAGCGCFDEVDLLARLRNLSLADAIAEFKKLAGVHDPAPTLSPRKQETPFDWAACVRDFTPEHQAKFAAWRGYSREFVYWLHAQSLVGVFRGRLAIAVRDLASGQVIRAHVRVHKPQPDGSEAVFWFYSPKGRTLPLVIGHLKTATNVWAFESQFDLFAALDLAGWHKSTEGLPGVAAVATRGAENGKLLAGLSAPGSRLVLFPQSDPPKSDRPETPAEKWTREAAATAGCKTVQVVPAPGGFKDINDALKAGLTGEEFQDALAAAKPYTQPAPPVTVVAAAPPKNVSPVVIALPPEAEDEAEGEGEAAVSFPINCLPASLAGIVAAVARCERVPLALPAVCALGVASAAIGAGLEVTSAPGRVTRGNLFLLASGESGSGKSQVFRRIADPIVLHQTALHDLHKTKTGPALAAEIAVLNREIGSLEKKAAGATGPSDRERLLGEIEYRNARRDELAAKATPPCVMVGDVTSEKLAALLAANRETLFSGSPEARQIVDVVCGRYNSTKTTDEALYLSGFSGDFVRVDRLGREPLTLRRPCLSVLWLVQPDAMARLFDEASLAASGFLPRFLACHTQASPRKILEGEAQAVSDAIRTQWASLIAGLLAKFHAADAPYAVQPAPEAKQSLDAFYNEIVDRRETDLADVGQFAARHAEQAWRIALILHAALHGATAHDHPLAAETAANGIALARWFAAQQLDILSKGRRQAAAKQETEILALIATNQQRRGQHFCTARDVYRARIVPTAAAAGALLERMATDGLLTIEDVQHAAGGRPTRLFHPVKNPVPE